MPRSQAVLSPFQHQSLHQKAHYYQQQHYRGPARVAKPHPLQQFRPRPARFTGGQFAQYGAGGKGARLAAARGGGAGGGSGSGATSGGAGAGVPLILPPSGAALLMQHDQCATAGLLWREKVHVSRSLVVSRRLYLSAALKDQRRADAVSHESSGGGGSSSSSSNHAPTSVGGTSALPASVFMAQLLLDGERLPEPGDGEHSGQGSLGTSPHSALAEGRGAESVTTEKVGEGEEVVVDAAAAADADFCGEFGGAERFSRTHRLHAFFYRDPRTGRGPAGLAQPEGYWQCTSDPAVAAPTAAAANSAATWADRWGLWGGGGGLGTPPTPLPLSFAGEEEEEDKAQPSARIITPEECSTGGSSSGGGFGGGGVSSSSSSSSAVWDTPIVLQVFGASALSEPPQPQRAAMTHFASWLWTERKPSGTGPARSPASPTSGGGGGAQLLFKTLCGDALVRQHYFAVTSAERRADSPGQSC